MEKNLCFILDGKEIYMDMCLVEDEIPVFFSCVDTDNNYYVALCTDMDLTCYCVVKPTLTQLKDMLYGKISMRDIFTKQKFFWQVISRDGKAVNDIVEHKPMDKFAPEDLPLENAFFHLFNGELQEYAGLISRKVLEGEYASFPMITNEALKDINDGKEINAQVRYNTISVSASFYSKTIKVECVIKTKATENYKIEYKGEENCISTKEKRSNMAAEKVLLLAA
ncbi:MAG: hypothetical protein NC121_14985 [Blautia sp.]|nr:hypothetical protein [Blautia sp.]